MLIARFNQRMAGIIEIQELNHSTANYHICENIRNKGGARYSERD